MVIIIGWGPGSLPNQTYQIQSTKQNLQNQTYQTKPQNQTEPKSKPKKN